MLVTFYNELYFVTLTLLSGTCSIIEKDDDLSKSEVQPVLVVGAGLSAADAIMAARSRGIPVLHVFRDSSGDWEKTDLNFDRLQWLPASIYPDYHKVYEMMAVGGTKYPLYTALPGYSLINFGPSGDDTFEPQDRNVTLCSPNGQLQSFRVSSVAILIGKYNLKCGLPGKSFELKFIPDQSDLFRNLFPRQSELIRVNPKKVFNLV